jgi:uncharacterized protein (TIGR02598 family)
VNRRLINDQKSAPPFVPKGPGRHCGVEAFSLVEIVIALGIATFALVLLLALLPAGVNNFRQTINATMASQISQRIFNQLQISDFENIPTRNTNFFDDQGNQLTNSNSTFCTYLVLVTISTNAASGTNATIYTGYTSQNLYTATVVVGLNPRDTNIPISSVCSSTNPNAITFSTLIGHN